VQGSLFKGKENEHKGRQKQDKWIDDIITAVEDPSSKIEPAIRQLMTNLLGFDNIPRKKKPFGNFVKNSLKLWDDRKIDAMWQVIEEVGNAAKAAAAAAKKAEETAKSARQDVAGKTEPSTAGKQKWIGWKRAMDEELKAQDGSEMPWKKLRTALLARYKACNGTSSTDDVERLGYAALAAIPDAYLSKKDNLVRLRPVA
jgi:hypothetical protein